MKNETDLQVLVDLNYKDNPNQNKPINPQKNKTTQDILNHLVLAQPRVLQRMLSCDQQQNNTTPPNSALFCFAQCLLRLYNCTCMGKFQHRKQLERQVITPQSQNRKR